MKNKSSKIKKLESERFSVFTEDLSRCYYCPMPRSDLHELLFGTNRNNSMRYGFVLPLCHTHHQLLHTDKAIIDEWHRRCQKYFEATHSRDEFISIFHRNYLD